MFMVKKSSYNERDIIYYADIAVFHGPRSGLAALNDKCISWGFLRYIFIYTYYIYKFN